MSSLHVGKAGQLAAMAEFPLRGYNVAMPEVDTGDDIFVVNDPTGEFWRIQVKTALGVPHDYGFSGRFAIDLTQLTVQKTPDLYYVLALRQLAHWEFVVLSRATLRREYVRYHVGVVSQENLVLNLRCHEQVVLCSGRDWQRFRNNWSRWPLILR